jgi:tetratricopeptide (TPR) repeat protein
MVYLHQKRYNEAKRLFEQILEENPNFYEAVYRLGMISEALADLDAALKYFKSATALKPHEEDAWMSLYTIYHKRGNASSAEEAVKEVIAVASRKLQANPDDLIVMSRLAEAYARFACREEAYATLKRVVEIDSSDGLALYHCSSAYGLLGEKQNALLYLRRAFDSGFTAVANWARTNPAFETFQTDKEYVKMIAAIE